MEKLAFSQFFQMLLAGATCYATLPCPPSRTGPTYATGPHSARGNTLGRPRFARDGHCVPAPHASPRSATPKTGKQVKNRSKTDEKECQKKVTKRAKMGQISVRDPFQTFQIVPTPGPKNSTCPSSWWPMAQHSPAVRHSLLQLTQTARARVC